MQSTVKRKAHVGVAGSHVAQLLLDVPQLTGAQCCVHTAVPDAASLRGMRHISPAHLFFSLNDLEQPNFQTSQFSNVIVFATACLFCAFFVNDWFLLPMNVEKPRRVLLQKWMWMLVFCKLSTCSVQLCTLPWTSGSACAEQEEKLASPTCSAQVHDFTLHKALALLLTQLRDSHLTKLLLAQFGSED